MGQVLARRFRAEGAQVLVAGRNLPAAAVWLASDECYMTGENLQVNGGLALRGNPSAADTAESVAQAGAGS